MPRFARYCAIVFAVLSVQRKTPGHERPGETAGLAAAEVQMASRLLHEKRRTISRLHSVPRIVYQPGRAQ
jgi:hypothetical protein